MASTPRASATARLIAAATVRASYDGTLPRPDADAVVWSRRLLRSTSGNRLLLWSVEKAVGRAFWRLLERAVAPGIVQHFQRRKAWIDERVRTAQRQGYTQLIVLGGGLDTLGVRVATAEAPPRVIELDHPSTQALKREVFANCGAAVQLVPVDFSREPSYEAASRTGLLDHDRDTVVVAEGLLMYLRPLEVELLLKATAQLRVPRVLLIGTFMERVGSDPPAFRPRNPLVDLWLKHRDEPFLWGASLAEAEALLNRCGFDLRESAGERALAERWPGRVLEGEIMVTATRRPVGANT